MRVNELTVRLSTLSIGGCTVRRRNGFPMCTFSSLCPKMRVLRAFKYAVMSGNSGIALQSYFIGRRSSAGFPLHPLAACRIKHAYDESECSNRRHHHDRKRAHSESAWLRSHAPDWRGDMG